MLYGITPTEPDEVGYCAGCGGLMYDYEASHCYHCGAHVHNGCEVKCYSCGFIGCKACLVQDQEDLEWYCPNCITPAAKAARACARTGSPYHLRQYLRIRKRGA